MAVTLEQIKNHMVNYFSDMESDDDDDYYDEDGHCGGDLLSDIKIFWDKFSTNEDFIYVVSGRWASDDIDLDGGRDYFFSHSKVIPMLFDYLYNTLGYSLKEYQKCIWNSVGLTDDIYELYDLQYDEPETLELKIDHKPIQGKLVLKYPAEMKSELDNNPLLKFIGLSRIDSSPIYMMEVPNGYTIVSEINEILK